MSTRENILVIGAGGQVGTELVEALVQKYSADQVIATDIADKSSMFERFELLDAKDSQTLAALCNKHKITQIYHLAAILSASGEQNPQWAWQVNMDGLLNVLGIATEKKMRVYWPSSIAVFGPNTPADNTPQNTIMEPTTMYGISKLAGEQWCNYYHLRYGLDVRSLRYPGLIGYKSLPGGGTTDYAVDIFHKALANEKFTCFLSEKTFIPMMYMPDAIKATLAIMDAPAEQIKQRTSYNLGAIDFSPEQIAAEIKAHIPTFAIEYAPDFRQQIADSWPNSIDDSIARQDWGWKHDFDLAAMTKDMLENLRKLAAKQ